MSRHAPGHALWTRSCLFEYPSMCSIGCQQYLRTNKNRLTFCLLFHKIKHTVWSEVFSEPLFDLSLPPQETFLWFPDWCTVYSGFLCCVLDFAQGVFVKVFLTFVISISVLVCRWCCLCRICVTKSVITTARLKPIWRQQNLFGCEWITMRQVTQCRDQKLPYHPGLVVQWQGEHDQGPGTKNQEPRTKNQGPGTRDQGQAPRTRDQGPGTRDQGPGTGTKNQGPGTRDQGPGTRDQGPGTGTKNQGPGTRDRHQEPGTRDQGPGTRDQGKRNWHGVGVNFIFQHTRISTQKFLTTEGKPAVKFFQAKRSRSAPVRVVSRSCLLNAHFNVQIRFSRKNRRQTV